MDAVAPESTKPDKILFETRISMYGLLSELLANLSFVCESIEISFICKEFIDSFDSLLTSLNSSFQCLAWRIFRLNCYAIGFGLSNETFLANCIGGVVLEIGGWCFGIAELHCCCASCSKMNGCLVH